MKAVATLNSARQKQFSSHKLALSLEALGVLSRQNDTFFGDLSRRAQLRGELIAELMQSNIETVVQLALERTTKSCLAPPDNDWLLEFIALAEKTSNPKMQELWAKVLVAESQAPGSFSTRALRLLANISPFEAALIRKAKSITMVDTKLQRGKILLGYSQKLPSWYLFQQTHQAQLNLARCGLNYPDILTLVDIGVLHSETIETGTLEPNSTLKFMFNGAPIGLVACKKHLVLNYLKYTMVGEQLSKLTKMSPNEKYWKALEQSLRPAFLLQRNH
ncbi:MAG: TIGR03899 family protein [Idiomarinaceae bacterium HL-53]|nr:MAG: TIGR03899 family protein [Idiomarinaceae bacterium HL-53]CUS48228.1 TIGR03899 family protein [Idiomarinaceae bacterium HL-53]